MRQIDAAVIGTGWCGGIRAETCAKHPLTRNLYAAEIRQDRLSEIERATGARMTTDYRELLDIKDIEAVFISTTPETTHFPIARDALLAGKHVLMEKPLALELSEADELIAIARRSKLKLTVGYSQRFSPKYAYLHKCVKEGTIGQPVSALVSRHVSRSLGQKITGRIGLSPAAMESTHDLDCILWCLEPAKPVRVYSQLNFGAMRQASGADVPDNQWMTVTMDSGLSFVVGGGWSLPPGYPNYSTTWIEFVGTDGALFIDDSHKDVVLSTMDGIRHPLSTMPGEPVDHIYAGPMAAETVHFLEAVAYDRPVLVTPEHARLVMEVYQAADQSAARGEPVSLQPTGA